MNVEMCTHFYLWRFTKATEEIDYVMFYLRTIDFIESITSICSNVSDQTWEA